jgi:chromosome segregation ATPase
MRKAGAESQMHRSAGPSRPSTAAEAKHSQGLGAAGGALSREQEEYHRLAAEYQEQAAKHRADEGALQQALEAHRHHNQHLEEQLHQLEQKNSMLQSKLERWAARHHIPLDQSLSSSIQSIVRSPSKHPPQQQQLSSHQLRSMLQTYAELKFMVLDLIQLYQKIVDCEIDHEELSGELEPLLAQQRDKQTHVKKQLKEVKRKLKVILVQIKEIRSSASSDPASLNDLLRDAKLYQEHYDELSSRLESSQGLLDAMAVQRLQELEEEMEAVETEAKLHRQRLAEHRGRFDSYAKKANLDEQDAARIVDIAVETARYLCC